METGEFAENTLRRGIVAWAVMRIQSERGHRMETGGPYQWL